MLPNPLTVDCKELSRKGVDTRLLKLTEDKYPALPNPLTVDMSCAEEIYPNVPNPKVVEVKLVDVTSPVPDADALDK